MEFPGEISSEVRASVEAGAQSIFVSGGDGSVGAAAHVLCGSDVVLGVLPTGTANVWATELGLPTRIHGRDGELARAALLQAQGEIRRMDLGRCGEQCFMLWAGVGLDARIVQVVEPRSRVDRYLGLLNYCCRGLLAAVYWRGSPMMVSSEDETISGCMIGVIASNIGRFAGGIIKLDPLARVDDGQMSMWCFKGRTFLDTVGHLGRMLRGRHAGHRHVHLITGKRFVVETSQTLLAQLDGEVTRGSTRFVIEILPSALNVFLANAKASSIFRNRMG